MCCFSKENEELGSDLNSGFGDGWLLICMIDMSCGGVCLCVHPQCVSESVREVFWGNWGKSDGNDLIEEEWK